jgi:hypothetical protein
MLFRKKPEPFKRCSLCNAVWHTKDEFLTDPNIKLNGYQKTSHNVRTISNGGLLLFTHSITACGTTLAMYAKVFKEKENN